MEQQLDIQETKVDRSATPSKFATKKMATTAVGLVVASAMAWAVWSVVHPQTGNKSEIISTAHADSSKPAGSDPVVATVNGDKVTQSEIAGLLNTGVDKAIVVDRYINKVIAAEKAQQMYTGESKAALRAAEREVLSTLYTTRRMEALRAKVTDADVKAYYDKNVLDDNYKQWKVSYYLSADQKDVAQTLEDMKKGDKKALAELKPLVDNGEGYANAAQMPYNLGRIVSKMKKGDFSEPLPLRNGMLVLRIDDVKQSKKPTLDEVKPEIVQRIATQKFNEELEQARRHAKVELG